MAEDGEADASVATAPPANGTPSPATSAMPLDDVKVDDAKAASKTCVRISDAQDPRITSRSRSRHPRHRYKVKDITTKGGDSFSNIALGLGLAFILTHSDAFAGNPRRAPPPRPAAQVQSRVVKGKVYGKEAGRLAGRPDKRSFKEKEAQQRREALKRRQEVEAAKKKGGKGVTRSERFAVSLQKKAKPKPAAKPAIKDRRSPKEKEKAERAAALRKRAAAEAAKQRA